MKKNPRDVKLLERCITLYSPLTHVEPDIKSGEYFYRRYDYKNNKIAIKRILKLNIEK